MSLNIIDAAEIKAPTLSQATPAPAPDRTTWNRQKFAMAAAFLAGLAMSYKLWLTDRWFPFTPAVPGLPPLPAPLDSIAFGLMIVALLAIAFVSRPARWIGLFTATILVLAAADQMRWQPWAYQYLWMLGAFAIYTTRSSAAPGDQSDRFALNICRLVVVCTYFWSGLQKMNAEFIDVVFPFVTQPLTSQLSPALAAAFLKIAYAAPVVETALGIGLLFPRTRRLTVIATAAMHFFILLGIGPFGRQWNSVVWPWNVAMIAFTVILFSRSSYSVSAPEILWPRIPTGMNLSGRWYPKLAFLMLAVLPCLSLFNRWDAFLSFSLYSGGNNDAGIRMTTAFADRLPKPILYHVFLTNTPGFVHINLIEWGLDELNVPVNPEPRVYRSLARYFCSFEKQPGEMRAFVTRRHQILSHDQRQEFDCATLAQ